MFSAIIFLFFAVAAVSAKNVPQNVQNKGDAKLEMDGNYHFSTAMKSWYDARIFCGQNNLKLVSIETADEAKEIQTIAPSKVFYWTSGSDVGHEHGSFFWATNVSISHSFELWGQDEPNDYLITFTEVSVAFDSNAGQIFDEPYWNSHNFICEMLE